MVIQPLSLFAMLTAHCSLCSAHQQCTLLTAHCSLLINTVHCSLLTKGVLADIEAASGVDLRYKFLAQKMKQAGY